MIREIKENGCLAAVISFWWLFLIALVIIGSLIWLAFMPTYNNMWIKQFRTTNQYQTTKEQLLFKLQAEYEKLDAKAQENNTSLYDGQKKALVERMDYEAEMLRDAGGTVPTEIVAFLEAHKR